MPKVKNQAFDIRESQLTGTHADVKTFEELGSWICQELDIAIGARGESAEDIRYAWTLYEQGRTRGKNAPWPDAADLTSPYGTEYTDMLLARIMQTLFQDNVWLVDGFGESAQRAPFVEEFHQRTQEEERLQTYMYETLLRSLIEKVGTLEVSEAVDLRLERKTIQAKLALDPTNGAPIMGEDNTPIFETGPDGNPVEAQNPQEPSAAIQLDVMEPVRVGPDYDVIPKLDFLVLPAHARHRSQIWGYAKRLWRRTSFLKARAKQGLYDPKAVEACGDENERDALVEEGRLEQAVGDQKGPTAEKPLWQVKFLADLDGTGERWWHAVVHKDKRVLLTLKFDDQTTRYIRFIPFPKPGTMDGYSFILNKMGTVIEEDTAVRNMRADKAALAISAPIKITQGALYDPYEMPFGPHSHIYVRDQNEVQQMELSDVPQSINVWKQDLREDADRLAGQNDTSFGQTASGDATLGEVRLKAGYVEVRTDLIIKLLKEPMEELFQARHNIWKRTLQSRKEGLPIPQSMAFGLEARGIPLSAVSVDGRISPEALDGQFWGKPRNSVESADMNAQMGYFNQFLSVLPPLSQMNQTIGMLLSTPQAAKAIMEQALRVFRWPDKQAFLGSEALQMIQMQQQQAAMMADPRMQLLMGMLQAGGAPTGPSGPQPGGGPPPAMQQASPMGVM